MAGGDPRDATTLDLPVPQLDITTGGDLSGFRVGIPQEYFISGINLKWRPPYGRQSLAGIAGRHACAAHLPHTQYALPVYYLIAPAEASANLARYDGVRYGPRLPAEAL